ncbi:c6 transcription factor [Fusarium tjaetaba]|uniref:C6 transcription factor n=1 Tax=Fusarium tjaetaba TaxID=1567544 RepID=A0A8H5RBB5_9HYPO|nr:c6 transcription factor [Fusarium tjaetaba]KAF5629888.1 c6 transcription factor [Fusarium tjaetaba]
MADVNLTVQQTSMDPNQNFGHYMNAADQSSRENGAAQKKHKNVKYRFLSPTEWAILARGVGGIKDIEDNKPVHPTSSLWPPNGIPHGLYRDCIYRRTVSSYSFHLIGFIRAIFFVLQLMIGASITALSAGGQNDTAITILAASNTVIAGLLALLHNSGIPDRYRYDKSEFQKVEDHIREVLATGIVRADQSVQEAIAKCYDRLEHARRTVEANMPSAYSPSSSATPPSRRGSQPQHLPIPPMPMPMPIPARAPTTVASTPTHTRAATEPITPPRKKSLNAEAAHEEKGPTTSKSSE